MRELLGTELKGGEDVDLNIGDAEPRLSQSAAAAAVADLIKS